MDEDVVIPDVQFPKIPDDVDEELRDYFIELERVLKPALRASVYLNKLFEGGFLGN